MAYISIRSLKGGGGGGGINYQPLRYVWGRKSLSSTRLCNIHWLSGMHHVTSERGSIELTLGPDLQTA